MVCKEIGIRKSEFVAKTQFLSNKSAKFNIIRKAGIIPKFSGYITVNWGFFGLECIKSQFNQNIIES